MATTPLAPEGEQKSKQVAQPRPVWRWVRRIIVVLVMLVAAMEVGVRLYAHAEPTLHIYMGAGKVTDSYRQVRLQSNYHGRAFQTNSNGTLGPDFSARQAQGSLRIVTLGDSCSFMPVERNYPRVLEEQLREKYPGGQIDVINASVVGYGTDQARIWYEREIDGWDHNVLVIYLGWNDMPLYNPENRLQPMLDEDTLSLPATPLITRAISSSYAFRGLMVLRHVRARREPLSVEPLSADDTQHYRDFYPRSYAQNLKAIIGLAKSRGRKVRLLNYASLYRENPTEGELERINIPASFRRSLPTFLALKERYEFALRKVAAESETPILDIASLFKEPAERLVFTDAVHFTPEGSERIGSFLAEEIAKEMQRAQLLTK